MLDKSQSSGRFQIVRKRPLLLGAPLKNALARDF